MSRQRFIGDIKPDTNNPDAEYVRIARWLDKFLPKEPIKTYNVKLSNNLRATYESIEVIKKLIEEGKKDVVIRNLAEKLTQYLPPKNYKKEIKAVYDFVTRRLRYTKDIHRVETVHRARDLLRRHRKAADCDDFVILTGALLQAIGHPVRIVIIGSNHKDKEDFSHIYLQTQVNNKWVTMDGSVPGAKLGWEAPKYAAKKIINLDGTEITIGEQPAQPNFILWIIIGLSVYSLVK